jgi:hypothetical protein
MVLHQFFSYISSRDILPFEEGIVPLPFCTLDTEASIGQRRTEVKLAYRRIDLDPDGIGSSKKIEVVKRTTLPSSSKKLMLVPVVISTTKLVLCCRQYKIE